MAYASRFPAKSGTEMAYGRAAACNVRGRHVRGKPTLSQVPYWYKLGCPGTSLLCHLSDRAVGAGRAVMDEKWLAGAWDPALAGYYPPTMQCVLDRGILLMSTFAGYYPPAIQYAGYAATVYLRWVLPMRCATSGTKIGYAATYALWNERY
eukprot:2258993-Rhodomonas_salina.8